MIETPRTNIEGVDDNEHINLESEHFRLAADLSQTSRNAILLNDCRAIALNLMAESFGSEYTVVLVTANDPGGRPRTQLWVAAAKPRQAITLVLSAVPEGWTGQLATGQLTPRQLEAMRDLRLKPGEIYELSK